MLRQLSSIGLGLWLFGSALLRPDNPAQFDNTWIAGALVVGFAIAALMGQAWGRWMNGLLGVWLIFSIAIFPPNLLFTALNLPIVGSSLVVLALWPKQTEPHFVGSLISGPQ
jgi:uncharacterized membrane protein